MLPDILAATTGDPRLKLPGSKKDISVSILQGYPDLIGLQFRGKGP